MTTRNSPRRLTHDQVRAIRSSSASDEELAARLEVSTQTVQRARTGQTYRHAGQTYRHAGQPNPVNPTNPATGAVIVTAAAMGAGTPGPAGYAATIQAPRSVPILAQGRDTQSTANRILLQAIDHALTLVNDDETTREAPLIIRTPLQYIALAINRDWPKGWIQRDWQRADGQPVAHADLWQSISRRLLPHRTTAATLPHDTPDRLLQICHSTAAQQYDAAENTATKDSSHAPMLPESPSQVQKRILETIFANARRWAHQGTVTARIDLLHMEYNILTGRNP